MGVCLNERWLEPRPFPGGGLHRNGGWECNEGGRTNQRQWFDRVAIIEEGTWWGPVTCNLIVRSLGREGGVFCLSNIVFVVRCAIADRQKCTIIGANSRPEKKGRDWDQWGMSDATGDGDPSARMLKELGDEEGGKKGHGRAVR